MSQRSLSAGLEAAITAGVVYPVILLEGEFTTGTGRWWTGYGPLSWNGYTWSGLGEMVGVSMIGEGTDVSSKGFTVSLSGQNQANVALALGACRQGASGKIWLGCLDASGNLISSPYLLRRGQLDVPEMSEDADSAIIVIHYEDILVDLERAREFRYTTESQALFYPGDKGFEFVPSLQDANDVWKPA